ncbi:SpvB/TcaC N-terminal domain-containing protein [Sorangium sp. So ce296]|uniref:SpvB/TcaC N-terminal domain-containing protein n=1 Tax=Sorangium sp. So ce296 TaxID=3133296 RepID=UPI003F60D32C
MVLLLGRGHEGLALAGPPEPRLLSLSPPGGGVALSAIPLRLPSDGAGGLLLGPRLDAPLVEDVGAPHGEMVLPDQARVVAFEGAVLEIPQGAVDEPVRITIRPLSQGEVRPMGRAMVNVTPGGRAYRFGPHGLRFKKPVRLTLPVDEHAIPPGMTAQHVTGFYFDEALGTWQRVERAGEAAKGKLASLTDHFTDFINATLAMPDAPGARSFDPSSIKGLALGSPLAGVALIAPPESSSSGAAQLSHPIVVPPGRNGIQPSLAIRYDSEHRNGWLGVGWDLRLSRVEIDTRFGVPTYATGEERYALDGSELVRTGDVSVEPQVYRQRVEGRFARILRHGTGPDSYHWEVTDKDGMTYVYGRSEDARLADPDPDRPGNVFRWYLEEVRDPFGNQMFFHYAHRVEPSGPAPLIEVHPERIEYTANTSQGVEAAYAVDFISEGGRKDVTLNGRPGFLEQTSERLRRVDVRFGETIIRSYALEYAEGDFGKSLLQAIAVLGKGSRDGEGTLTSEELYRHTFEYFTAPRTASGQPGAFAAEAETWGQAWSQKGLSRTEDSTFGGSVSVGLLGIVSVGGGGYSGDQTTRASLLDLNGDGLPDFAGDGGDALRNLLRLPDHNHFDPFHLGGLSPGDLGLTDTSGWSVHAGINVGDALSASAAYTRSRAEDERVVSDLNGDGFPDLVSVGGLGQLQVALNDRRGGFLGAKDWGAVAGSAPSGRPDFALASRADFFPADPMLRWIAPFEGDVRIGGVLQKQEAGGDGLRVELVRNGELPPLFGHAFGPDELGPCAIGAGDCGGAPLSVHVLAGDRLYFRVSAAPEIDPERVVNTASDLLSWSPTITYEVSEELLGQVGPDGRPIHRFEYAQDHRLGGRPEVPWVASSDGLVSITGDLVKGSTSDQLRVSIARESEGTFHSVMDEEVVSADAGVLALAGRIHGDENGLVRVKEGDRLWFRVKSDVPDDPARVSWTPMVDYRTYCRADRQTGERRCGPVQCVIQPNGRAGCKLDSDTAEDAPLPVALIQQQPYVAMPVQRWRPGARRSPWIATETGTVRLEGTVVVPGNTSLTLLVQGVHRLLHKQLYVPASSAGSAVTMSVDLQVQAGEPIYVTLFQTNPADSNGAIIGASIDGAPVWFTVLVPDPASEALVDGAPQDPTAGGFHGWSVGFMNGDRAFSEADILFPTRDPERGFTLAVPLSLEDGTRIWGAAASEAFVGGDRVLPSVVGRLSGQRHRGSVRYAETWNAELTAGAGPVGGGYSFGSTTTDLELIDLNGDRYPDRVTREGAVLNTGRGFGASASFSLPEALRRVEHRTVRLSGDLASLTFSAGDEEEQTLNKTDSRGRSQGYLRTSFSAGTSYGLSAAHVELLDINGDGLVDQVTQNPESEEMTVALNLGYRFTAPVPWQRDGFTKGSFDAGELNGALGEVLGFFSDAAGVEAVRLEDTGAQSVGFGASAGGSSGGVSASVGAGIGYTRTTARTIVDFVDMNGDGLPDKVMKDPGETSFRVQLNLGDRFAAEEQWPAGAWGVNIDPQEYTFMGGGDAVGFRRSESLDGSVSLQVCYFVCIGGSVYYSEGSGGSQLGFEDIDGDGLADHVLKRDGDSAVRARKNAIGKANLLWRVHRPLGGSVELDYRREGNLVVPREVAGNAPVDDSGLPADDASTAIDDRTAVVDMPSSQWVLSDVVARDGVEGVSGAHGVHTYWTQIGTYGDGVYHRDERLDLGYRRVTTTTLGQDEDGVSAMSVEEVDYRNEDIYRRGLAARSTLRDGDGMLYTVEEIEHQAPDLAQIAANGWFFPRETARRSAFYEGITDDPAATHKSTRETRSYDEDGNLTDVFSYGEEGTSADDVHHHIKYEQDDAPYFVKARLVQTTDAEGRVLRERTATYGPGTGALATLTNVIRGGKRPDGSPYAGDQATWSFAYDELGNLATFTDPASYKLTYGYDALTQSYRTCVTDSFGYRSISVPNYAFGTVAQETDVNGHTIAHRYDDFGRLIGVWGPNDLTEPQTLPVGCTPSKIWSEEYLDGEGEPAVGFEYALQPNQSTAPPAWARTSHKDAEHPGDPIVTVTFADGLGRVIQTKKDLERDTGTGTEVGMTVSGAVAFDALGRVKEQGQPVFSTEPDTTFVAVGLLRPSHFHYDVLSRTRRVEAPDPKAEATDGHARTLIEYDVVQFDGRLLFQETVIDANGKSRSSYRDVGGRIAAVEEWNTIDGVQQQIVTRYEHNPLGELLRVTDARNNATTATYDSVGRMVELVSPDAGRTEWRYDLAGNLRAKQTAELGLRGQLIRYEYTYNRLSKIDYPVTQDVVYTYGAADEAGDAKGNRAGRLTQETSAAGTRSYRYDRFGNVAELVAEFPRLREPHRGPYQATLSYVFDSLGRMQEIHFPGSGEEIVRYGYDRGGLLVSAIGENQKVNPQHPDEPMTTEYLRHIGYDEFGQRVRVVAGNGVETKYRYNESTRRLSEVDADHRTPQMQQMGRPPRAFQRLRYDYDLVGNVLALDNAVPFDESLGGAVMVATTQQRFAYDDLNQLTAASGTYQERGHEQQRYTLDIAYDVLGNVKKKGQEVARYVPNGPGQWRFEQPIRERTYRNEYRYTGPRPHAANQVDEFVPAESQPRLRELFHDANGNHKEWKYRGSPQRALSWDEDNRLVSVRENGQELSRALYDGAGERRVHLHRVAGEEETAYVDQHLVVRNGVTATKHIFAGETRIASKIDADWFQEPPVLYYHPDHLGSTQYVTDQDQQLSQHVEYLPSGELWTDQTDSRFQNRQPYLFNGKELDLSTGLYHYGARSYEPRLGVWLSPDPILDQYMRGAPNGGVYSPSNLWSYTYTGNNPVVCIDKDGRFAWIAVAAVAVGVLFTPQYANAPGHNEPIHNSKSGIELGYEMAQTSLTAYGAMSNPAGFAQAYMQQQAIATIKDAADTVDPSGSLRGAIEKVEPVASMMAPGGKGGGPKLGVKASAPKAPKAAKPDGYAARYADGTLVKESQRPPHVSGPDPAAGGRPHTVLRWDANGRLYGAKEFGNGGTHPTRDMSFTQPTFPNGTPRPDHMPPPTAHPYLPNPTGGSPKRGPEGPLNP